MPKFLWAALRYGWPYFGTVLAIGMAAWWLYDKGYTRCQNNETVKKLSTLVEVKHAQHQAYATAPRSRADIIERLHNGRF